MTGVWPAPSFETVERFPLPPACERCGGAVGLWEPILAGPLYQEPTTWLALSERWGPLPERVLHHSCPERDDRPGGR